MGSLGGGTLKVTAEPGSGLPSLISGWCHVNKLEQAVVTSSHHVSPLSLPHRDELKCLLTVNQKESSLYSIVSYLDHSTEKLPMQVPSVYHHNEQTETSPLSFQVQQKLSCN